MLHTYKIREDIIHDEDGIEYIVYGIDALDPQKRIVQSFPDIFFEKEKAMKFVNLCNECELELIHLADVVDDALTEQYAVFH